MICGAVVAAHEHTRRSRIGVELEREDATAAHPAPFIGDRELQCKLPSQWAAVNDAHALAPGGGKRLAQRRGVEVAQVALPLERDQVVDAAAELVIDQG